MLTDCKKKRSKKGKCFHYIYCTTWKYTHQISQKMVGSNIFWPEPRKKYVSLAWWWWLVPGNGRGEGGCSGSNLSVWSWLPCQLWWPESESIVSVPSRGCKWLFELWQYPVEARVLKTKILVEKLKYVNLPKNCANNQNPVIRKIATRGWTASKKSVELRNETHTSGLYI